jgi:hypothetical protein
MGGGNRWSTSFKQSLTFFGILLGGRTIIRWRGGDKYTEETIITRGEILIIIQGEIQQQGGGEVSAAKMKERSSVSSSYACA